MRIRQTTTTSREGNGTGKSGRLGGRAGRERGCSRAMWKESDVDSYLSRGDLHAAEHGGFFLGGRGHQAE